MAESISEGTLKQWSKRGSTEILPSGQYSANDPAEIGDYVEQDEEIATIETDKVQTYAPGYSFADTPSPIRLTSL